MDQILTVQQVQALDRLAIEGCGMPAVALMENAGRAVAEEILRRRENQTSPLVVAVCGSGNNAGDGFVALRHLHNAGCRVQAFLIGSKGLRDDAGINLRIFEQCIAGASVIAENRSVFSAALQSADFILDAIFGVGLNRPLEGIYAEVVDEINHRASNVIAVDIPSGLDGTTGEIHGTCVQADLTVTFSCAKPGFYRQQGPHHCGEVIVRDIGIPLKLKEEIARGDQ